MAPIFTTFRKAGRAAIIAVTLGAASLSAMPVQAQEPSASFQIELGQGQRDGGDARRGGSRPQRPQVCLSDRQIERGLASYGFKRVDVRRDVGRDRVEVRGNYGRWSYQMRVDRCSGRVDRVSRLRPSFPGGGNGFGLQFNLQR